jgi:hypothetical protein
MDVHLIGVDLMDVRLIGVALMSVMGVSLIGVAPGDRFIPTWPEGCLIRLHRCSYRGNYLC